MKKIIVLLTILTCIYSCKKDTKKASEISKTDMQLDELYQVMQGSYNSEIQSQVDSSYYNISLHMYPIWQGNGHYLYVE